MRKRLPGVAIIVAIAGPALSESPPFWTQVPVPRHFAYHADSKQVFGKHSNTFYLPGQFPPGEIMRDQLGCSNRRSTGPFWYLNGARMTGPREITTPAAGVVFSTTSPIRGIAFRGSWHPELSAPGAAGAVFYSNDPCYMGTLEYGFQREYRLSAPAYVGFYYSKYANCRNGGPALCHATDDNSPASVVSECAAGINLPDDIDFGSADKWYESYVFLDRAARKYKFNVRVVDANTGRADWECVVDPSAADPFGGDPRCHRTVNGKQNWSQNSCDASFPVSSLRSSAGSVTATVNSNNAKFPEHTPALVVTEIRVAR